MPRTNMTTTKRLAILRGWRDTIQKFNNLQAALDAIKVVPESPLLSVPLALRNGYIEAVAQLVGDDDGWLDWYANDNDMGRAKREAAIDGQFCEVNSLRQLLSAIDLTSGGA